MNIKKITQTYMENTMRFKSKIKWKFFKKSLFSLMKCANVVYKISVKLQIVLI